MLKLVAYAVRPDERPHFEELADELGVEVSYVDRELDASTVTEADGCFAVSIGGPNNVDGAVVERLAEFGVKVLATRSIGYNNIDLDAVRTVGIHVANARYAPTSVAEFTVMLALMGLRRMKAILMRGAAQDFSIEHRLGREICSCTVGILGTGRIGAAAARLFKGLGAHVLGYDVYENHSLDDVLTYAPLEEVLAQSDVISLHLPLLPSTEHIINDDAIAAMKDGVGIINCARGPIVDTPALVRGIKSGKIGFACLDTVEGELDYFHHDLGCEPIQDDCIALLRGYPNVIMTQHCSFYTDDAVRSMVESSLRAAVEIAGTGASSYDVI